MSKVAIIVDSTVDLNKSDYERYGIIVLPLIVNLDGKDYRDGVDIDGDAIYKKVSEGSDLPHTAGVSSETLRELFQKYIDEGFDVVFTGIGSTLSGTLQAANIAKMDLPEGRVNLIDSKNLSSGSGLLAIKCAELRDEGKSAKEIQETVQPLAEKVSTQFGIERLDFMAKGGRCSGFANLMARLFHIHPVLKVVDGKLIVYRKPRGRSEAFYDELLRIFDEEQPIDDTHVMLTHSGCDAEGVEYLRSRLAQRVDPKKIMITRAGAVISSHCGYGTIGILYIKK